jgi:hypothetical protein
MFQKNANSSDLFLYCFQDTVIVVFLSESFGNIELAFRQVDSICFSGRFDNIELWAAFSIADAESSFR